MDRHFGQRLAIHFDVGKLQTINELAVAKIMLATSGAQTRDPESTEVTLLLAAIPERIGAAAKQRLLDGAGQLSATSAIALGSLEETILRLVTSRTCGRTHDLLSCLMLVLAGGG